MELNFQNLYVLEVSIGLASLAYGGSLFNSNWISALILIIVGCFLTFYGITNWTRKQRNEEKLVELEVESKNPRLDLEIKDIDGENDIDYEPTEFDDAGQPQSWGAISTVSIKIKLEVYNPSDVKNIVKDVQVFIERDNKSTILKKDSFSPIRIEPKEFMPFEIKFFKRDFGGKKNDKIIVKILPMSGKDVPKERIISDYSKGDELKEALGDIQ